MNAVLIRSTMPVELKGLSLTTEAKLLYWTLVCNTYTSQSGLYEIRMPVIADLAELSVQEVRDGLDLLIRGDGDVPPLIHYATPLIFVPALQYLHNWHTWNYRQRQARQIQKRYSHLRDNPAYRAWKSTLDFDIDDSGKKDEFSTPLFTPKSPLDGEGGGAV